MKNLTNPQKVKYAFENLGSNALHVVDEFYHPNAEFKDPIGTIVGSVGIKKYYEGLYQNVKSIKFDFSQLYESGNTVIGVWTMTLQTDKLNSGKAFSVEGNSVVTFDEKGMAIYHRDYFDMGAFIYERIPVLGFVIKKIRNNLEHQQ